MSSWLLTAAVLVGSCMLMTAEWRHHNSRRAKAQGAPTSVWDSLRNPLDICPFGFGYGLAAILGGIAVWRHGNHRRTRRRRADWQLRQSTSRLETALEPLLQLNQMDEASSRDITEFALAEGVRLTGSKTGYLGLLNHDETTLTMYVESHAGPKKDSDLAELFSSPQCTNDIWREVVRARKPVIENRLPASAGGAKPAADGSLRLRHLHVPIFEGDRVVAVAGVENKEADYQEADGRQLTVIMTSMWRMLQRKTAAQKQKEYNALLEASNKALEEYSFAAQAATRAKSEFLANMSHELRTPMTAILGFADLLRRDGDVSRAPQKRLEAIETIARNGDHLLQLINGVLDLSKIESGKLDVEQVDCPLLPLLGDVQSLLKVRADSKGLLLEVGCDGPVPETIQTDPTRLRQILINLVGNAVKFTEKGKVRLEARLVREEGAAPTVAFDVSDTGIGIPRDQLENIFKPFAQADQSVTRRFGGTGLGLTVSRQFAQMLGGDVTVASTPGAGSTFRLSIPAKSLDGVRMIDAPAGANPLNGVVAEAAPGAVAPARKLDCRILLAEDAPDNQRLIGLVLKKAGAKVVVAENGEIAVQQVEEAERRGESFHLILMDMQMPVLDGYEATRRLRGAHYRRPIIALTAHAMAGDREKCLRAGCDDYTTKPIDRVKLIELVGLWATRKSESCPSPDDAGENLGSLEPARTESLAPSDGGRS
ncbi:MAG: ATP-binding protein [Pirellulales bacterium]